MSIFESPTAVQPRVEPVAEDESPRRGFDPRSVQVAGIITAALVVLGLLVSNAAKPDAEPRPALSSKAGPGAAAIEEAEDVQAPTQPSPSVAPPTAESEEPVAEDPASSESDEPAWQQPQDTAETDSSGDGKWADHPGKGHGRWR